MKRVKVLFLLVAVVAALSLPRVAEAQFRLAPEIVFADNVDFGIGGHAFFDVSSVPWMEIGTFFDFYFPDGGDYFELGGTVYYRFTLPDNPSIVPKAGAGLTVGFFSYDSGSPGVDDSNTEVGLHLLGGVDFPMNRITPFAELGFGIGDIPDFLVRGGVSFTIGG